MIIIDYSQLIIAGALSFKSDFDKGKSANKQIDIMRHTIISTILADKVRFGKEYGDVVLAVDDRNYWRREIFPHYKANRKKHRESSNTDWTAIFEIGKQLRAELSEVMPWKFVVAAGAEADDVIAVLTKYTQTNDLVGGGLYGGEPQRVLIKSSDGDFGQLHKFDNVRQWSPLTKKYVAKYSKTDLLEKIMTGDTGDGVPNIKSADDFFVNEDTARQRSITAKLKEQAFTQLSKFNAFEFIDFGDSTMNRNFDRNRSLIDFDYIPKNISDSIVETYINTKPNTTKGKIFDYFVQNRCKLLLERIQEI